MKKIVVIFSLALFLLSSSSVFASKVTIAAKKPAENHAQTKVNYNSSEANSLVDQVKIQQEIYNENARLAALILDKIIHTKLTFDEVIDLQQQLKETRIKYMDAANKMLDLKVQYFEMKGEYMKV